MKSLDCLNKETIILLNKNNLLKDLIKSELIKQTLSEVKVDKNLKIDEVNKFINNMGIKNESELNEWKLKNNISESDFENIVLFQKRLKIFKSKYSHQVESRFLDRKNDLDIVIYSLIRVSDFFTAREFYLRIVNNEADFGDLATEHSLGIEKKSRGIVGPKPMSAVHPALAVHLRRSKLGVTQPPIKIEQSILITRLETLDVAQLDDYTRGKMEEELFFNWIDTEVIKISDTFLPSIKSSFIYKDTESKVLK